MEPIGETIKKITAATSKDNMEKSDNTKAKASKAIPEKDVCPICGGLGLVKRDLPISDPNFGRFEVCECQKENQQRSTVQRLYTISNLDAYRDMTFASFDISGLNNKSEVNNTLEVAFNTTQNYARHLNGWLLLMGSYGCGKTHLAAAIANEVVSMGVQTLFLTVPDLLDWLRYSFGSQETTYESRFEEIKNIRFLVLDDLGTQNTTPWAREKLFQILNHRYTHKLPTVITTNLRI